MLTGYGFVNCVSEQHRCEPTFMKINDVSNICSAAKKETNGQREAEGGSDRVREWEKMERRKEWILR